MKSLELKIPPVLVVLAVAAVMWLVNILLPLFSFHFTYRLLTAIGLVTAGFLIALAGVLTFRRAKTTTNPMDPASVSSLVSSGIYSFTRNPMYLGFIIALLGWGFYLSNWLTIITSVLFIPYMNRFQIKPEERALEEKFGESFRPYKKHTRRWL